MRRLMLFGRRPAPGRVKSRLVPALGPIESARLYAAFLDDLLALLGRIAATGTRGEAWLTGPADDTFWRPGQRAPLALREQADGDLGSRLRLAFAESGPDVPTVVIGADAPNLPPATIERAFVELERGADAAVAPAEDGGYVLLATRGCRPELFDGIAWGGAGVLRATLERAERAALELAVLPDWYDVDRPRDLRRLARDVRAGVGGSCPRTAAWIEQHGAGSS